MSSPVAVLQSRPTPRSPTMHIPCTLLDLRMERFTTTVEEQFARSLTPETLHITSGTLQKHFNEACQSSKMSMLPSFCHTLPSGREEGMFLALDVGGSTLRVGLVQLDGRSTGEGSVHVLKSQHYVIDDAVRSLIGYAFFEWMADRIYETLEGDSRWLQDVQPLRIGLAWSFPVEQLSMRDGLLMRMGKGLRAGDGLLGENLADLVSDACAARNLHVSVEAIVNDSSSSLLAGAYQSKCSSPITLILGTGLNAAAHLPVSAISREKFGVRPASWHEAARHVLVNTEFSLFGKDVFPVTAWDNELNRNHQKPDFQPLEHLTSGRYLGEIVRLILVDAIRHAGLFDAITPGNFEPYALTTETIATIEGDRTSSLSQSSAILNARHPLPGHRRYLTADLIYVRHIITLVSSRAAAYLATALHAVCELKFQHEDSDSRKEDITIGCNGSVVEKYPDFMQRVQVWLDILIPSSSEQGRIQLELTGESALSGAAVAVACQN